MKFYYCLFTLIFMSSLVHSEGFKINSFYYIDSAPKPNETNSKMVFIIDRQVSCEGVLTNKIYVNKDTYNVPTTPYLLTRLWPSYFLKQAALSNAEVDVDFGRYEASLNACEVGFKYEGNSTERWYEPFEFKVSEVDDTNPINTVYYQLYINAQSPTYAPWVYADTDYSVSCDGITTNRVIPTPSPNEWGYIIPSEFGSQANLNYSSENTRSFFDLLSGKIDQYAVGRYVPELHACTIHNVQFSANTSNAEAIQIGMQQCIDDPTLCHLFSEEEIDSALQIGMQQCIDDPTLCHLFSEAEIDLALQIGIQDGIDQCIDSPASCSLFNQTSIDEAFLSGEEAGKAACIADPSSCNLLNLEDVNTLVDQRLAEAIKAIAKLLPKGIVKSTCKKHSESLLCVYADVDHGRHKQKHDKHRD